MITPMLRFGLTRVNAKNDYLPLSVTNAIVLKLYACLNLTHVIVYFTNLWFLLIFTSSAYFFLKYEIKKPPPPHFKNVYLTGMIDPSITAQH